MISQSYFSKEEIESLVKAIKFYEEQIIRVSLESNKTAVNLFKLQSKEKYKIIASQIKDIAYYIVENGNEFIWGKLTDCQKKKLLKTVVYNEMPASTSITRMLIKIFSDYTTLSEIENGVTTKVLNRFILK